VFGAVGPSDFVEEIWVHDLVDVTWTMFRWRQILSAFISQEDEPYVALEERTVGFPPTIVEDFGAALDTTAKIVGVSADFELLARCERDAHASLIDQASVVRSQPYYLDITHPLVNKGVALSEIANLLAVPLAEVAVIGDGGNDVAMFERSS
jgi:hydroxymethylpyrimidine pyrophosphatase-like HAD family hydrolase